MKTEKRELSGIEERVAANRGEWQYVYDIEESLGLYAIKAAKYITLSGEAIAYFKPGSVRLARDSFLHGFIQFLQQQAMFPKDYNPFVAVKPYHLPIDKIAFIDKQGISYYNQQGKWSGVDKQGVQCFLHEGSWVYTNKKGAIVAYNNAISLEQLELIFTITPSIDATVDFGRCQAGASLFGGVQPALNPVDAKQSGNAYHALLMIVMALLFNMRDLKADALFADNVLVDAEDFYTELDKNKYVDFPKIHLPLLTKFLATENTTDENWEALFNLVDTWSARIDEIQAYLQSQHYADFMLALKEIEACHVRLRGNKEEVEQVIASNVPVLLKHNELDKRGDFSPKILTPKQVDQFKENIFCLKESLKIHRKSPEKRTIIGMVENYDNHWRDQCELYRYMLQQKKVLYDFFKTDLYKNYTSDFKNKHSFPRQARLLLRLLENGETPVALAGDPRFKSTLPYLKKLEFVFDPPAFIRQLSGKKRKGEGGELNTSPLKRLLGGANTPCPTPVGSPGKIQSPHLSVSLWQQRGDADVENQIKVGLLSSVNSTPCQ